jgi:RHS repeat-associated protein
VLSNGSFPAGDYTLELKARNSSGQESQVVTVSFTLDWIAPPLSFGLAPESDTGEKGDNVTTEYKVNLIGQTEPGLKVMLVETQQMAVADETGAFRFNDVALPSAGKAPYSLIVSDAAGNLGRAQEFLTREGINGAPEITSTPGARFDPATQVTYAYQVEAIDPDGDELSYRLINAPSGTKIDGNGLLTFTPSGNTTPFYDFKVEVSDGRGGVETQTFTVEVLGVGEGLGTIRGMKWEDLNGDGKRSFYSTLFRTNGTASILPSATTEGESYINLTRATGNQFGTAFLQNPLDIVDSAGKTASFSSYFQFSLTNPGGLQGGGDSITFMIAPSNTATRYDGLNNSVAVELDTYNNGAIDDNSNNHIGILINGNRDAIAQTTVSPSFKNGARWNVWIDYNGATQTLEARVSQDLNRPINPTVSSIVNIPAILNREDVYIGLAASTGGAWAQHDVFAWDFEVNGSEINESLDILPNRTIEPGLAGVTVYLDLNDNEVLDSSEPFQVTAEDDPNTPDIDETGRYEFNYLEPGTYVVREIVPDGYIQTAPIGTVLGSMFDGDFNDEDWSSSYLVVSGTPTITEISEDQRLTGGNPGAYRHMIHHWGGGRIIVYHRYEDYTFDPSVRPFDTIDYVEDVRAINISGVIGQGMAIFQGGDIFRMLGRAFGNFDWQTWAVGGLKEADFFSDFTGNRPDFSENGAPMQFGYWRSNTNNGQRIQHGIDDWSVTLIDSSTNSYLVNLSAGEIVEKIDFGNALAGSVNIPPRIVSNPITTGYIGVPYQYQVAAIDGNGDALTYTLLKAPQGMEISDTGVITWATGAIGSYQVEVQVDDGKGGIVTQPYDLNVTEVPVDKEAPEVALGFSGTVLSVGETVNFQISGNDNFGLADLDISVNGQSLTLNSANIERGTIYTASFTPDKPGIFEVLATATDFGGNTDTETLSVRVLDPNDTSAPIAQLDISDFDPLNLVIREKTEIKGTINDQNLEFYRVELAPVSLIDLSNPAAKDPDYITIAEGTGNIDGILASIDPALYRNDNYFVRIYAQDINGNVTVEGFGVGIDSQTKPGEFSLDFTDLSIPLTGIPIEVTRRYSSLDANFQGDFGYGWELGLQDAQIVESAPTGVDLKLDNGLFGNSFTEGTRVTLTTPDGRRVGFTFTPEVFSPSAGIFLGPDYYAWRPKFTPDPGVYETLEVPYVPIMRLKDGSFGIYLFGTTYNPRDYILTTKDGTKYSYSQYNGLQKVEDRNSNTLTFTDNGITSSTGAKIDFIRDAQGRITEIIDPDGKSLKYSYDTNGNLIEFGDRTNNETTFKYEAEREHYLTEIIDPLNRTSVRTEYDENGQISKIFDADGNALDINYDSATSRQTGKDPFGNTTTYVFDPRGNVVSQIDALAGVTARTYDANNNLLSETDPEGNTTAYTYDSRGNKLSETDGEGNTKTYTYNARNDILSETDALGNITNYTYDAKGNLTRRQDALGNVTTYTYGQNGLLTEVIDANGKKSNFSYDGYGNITALVDPTGAKTTFTYDRNGRVASVTDALGAITNYVYDAQGRLIEKADPEGSSCGCARGITKTEYNAAGEKIAEIDALGRRTEYRYSDRGLLIETILPDETPADLTDNPRTKNEYDALDRLIVTVDELGRKTHYIYDKLGRQIEVIYPDATPNDLTDNPRTKKEYDKAGLVIAEIDELGNRTEFDYDKADRMIARTNALNEVTTYTYDADGRQISMTDALGRTTNYAYNGLDRLISTTYANNAVMATTYDPLGRIIAETDLAGNTTKYEYDALGRLTAVVDALNQRTEYKYDAVGNLIEQKDANGNITKFEYDSLRQRKATILPGGQRNETIHNKIGNLIRVTDFNGVTTTYEYNERNWLTEKSFSDGTPTENFTYTLTGELATVTDNRGVTSYVYDERDWLLSRTEPDGRSIQYTYDDGGNILTLIVPSGTTSYTYDPLNRIDTVTDPDGGVTDYTYNAVGNLIKTEFPNGITENQQYDLLNRLTYLENRDQTGIISSYTYTLDAMGNRTKVVENDGRTVEYTYDDLYRLTQEKIADAVAGNKVIDYKFDPVGNRLERIDSVEGTITYSYDANDRLLEEVLGGKVTEYQYDAKGNLTAKVENGQTQAEYEWNAKGELTAVEVTENGETGRIEFEYDHSGIRVAIKANGEETRFLIDKNQQQYAQVIEEYQANGTVDKSYVHGIDLISQEDANGRIYYQVDGLGSTRLLTDNNGAIVVEYDYDAYGNLTRKVGDADNNYLFAGEQFDDAVDGYYLRARYYDPATGRFNSTDPFEGYNNWPVTLHDYLYVGNNPVKYLDPSGLVVSIEYIQQKHPELLQVIKCLGGNIGTEIASQGLYILVDSLVPTYVGKAGGIGVKSDILDRVIKHVKDQTKVFNDIIVVNFPKSKSAKELVVLEEALIDYARNLFNLTNKNAAGVSKQILQEAREKIEDVLVKVKKGLC